MKVKHKKVSEVANSDDETLVQPSDWNDEHDVLIPDAVVGDVLTFTGGGWAAKSPANAKKIAVHVFPGVVQGQKIVIPRTMADTTHAAFIEVMKDEVINPGAKIPTMTSNTTPSGTASCSSNHASTPAFCAFTGPEDVTGWATGLYQYPPQYVQYQFPSPVSANEIGVYSRFCTCSWKLEASNNGTGWETIKTVADMPMDANVEQRFGFSDCTYIYWRFVITASAATYSTYWGYIKFQLYQGGDPYLTSKPLIYGTDYSVLHKAESVELVKLSAGVADWRVLIIEG